MFSRKKRHKPVSLNVIDRAINYVAPVHGARRFKARVFHNMAQRFYLGSSKSKRSIKEWNPLASEPDSALEERQTLTDRGFDLFRNAPLARGAVQTNVTNVIGAGLMLQPRINREVLNMTQDQAEELENDMKREFNFWADSLESDVRRTVPYNRSMGMAMVNMLLAGDVFALLRNFKSDSTPFTLSVQMVEGARISNENNAADTEEIIAGVKKNSLGAPVSYFISRFHPASRKFRSNRIWDEVQRFGENTGRQNVIHLFKPERPGQTRGISWLAPIIDLLKQLTTYTDAEITAAVVSGMFSVLVKTKGAQGLDLHTDLGDETGAKSTDKDAKLASGAIIDMDAEDEDITVVNPTRPNTAFGPFVEQILRQIGVALNIPFEILIKHFTSSYSASRAALMEAWKFFISERKWFATMYCQPVYAAWLDEAVAIGRISAPGYFNDPMIRLAYQGTDWVGPPRGMIKEKEEIEAAQKRVDMSVSTLSEETAALTGGNWRQKHDQRVKEAELRVEGKLQEPLGSEAPPAPLPVNNPDLEDLQDD